MRLYSKNMFANRSVCKTFLQITCVKLHWIASWDFPVNFHLWMLARNSSQISLGHTQLQFCCSTLLFFRCLMNHENRTYHTTLEPSFELVPWNIFQLEFEFPLENFTWSLRVMIWLEFSLGYSLDISSLIPMDMQLIEPFRSFLK
jgi:hypothetical protein